MANSSWANLFKAKASPQCGLEFTQTTQIEGATLIPPELILEGEKIWNQWVVGFFIDRRMPYLHVQRSIDKFWKLKGSYTLSLDRDLYYILFDDEEDRRRMLEAGPSYIGGKLFILRPWSISMEDQEGRIKSLPIWVKIWNLPRFLWTKAGLSYVGSIFGNPLVSDAKCLKNEVLEFARICIEVPANFKFVKTHKLKMGEGKFATISLAYPWIPFACSHCDEFGHKTSHCQHKVQQRWVQKECTVSCSKEHTVEIDQAFEVNDSRQGEQQKSNEIVLSCQNSGDENLGAVEIRGVSPVMQSVVAELQVGESTQKEHERSVDGSAVGSQKDEQNTQRSNEAVLSRQGNGDGSFEPMEIGGVVSVMRSEVEAKVQESMQKEYIMNMKEVLMDFDKWEETNTI